MYYFYPIYKKNDFIKLKLLLSNMTDLISSFEILPDDIKDLVYSKIVYTLILSQIFYFITLLEKRKKKNLKKKIEKKSKKKNKNKKNNFLN